MPDHGLLNANHFQNQKMVFSGHFHKRQNQGKVWYIGNCFPHNFADAWDDERGIMLWHQGKDPNFASWPYAPKYKTLNLSDVVADPAAHIDELTYAKITIDINASYEDITFIKELLEKDLKAREIQMIAAKNEDMEELVDSQVDFESVDTIVISHLQTIESNSIDKNELIRIYQEI
jgi:hypothetical protein